MKKLLFILIATLFVFAACSSDETETVTEGSEDLTTEESEESIEVDKGLLNVEVTLPASLFEEDNLDQITEEAKESGVKEVIQNDDGSITYKMSKSTHSEMMKEMEEEINAYMEDIVSGEDYTSISDVTSNKSFSEFTMSVDQEAFENSFDGFATLGLGINGMLYQNM